ncbi:hypothetical protein [Edaphobacter acidisoli]|uniref:hypothetical protein n=1 Tax=Edaphobacter acidisoli TaxID=2040573 RepID=UPI003570EA6C
MDKKWSESYQGFSQIYTPTFDGETPIRNTNKGVILSAASRVFAACAVEEPAVWTLSDATNFRLTTLGFAMRKSRLSWPAQRRSVEPFVAGTAAALVGVMRKYAGCGLKVDAIANSRESGDLDEKCQIIEAHVLQPRTAALSFHSWFSSGHFSR